MKRRTHRRSLHSGKGPVSVRPGNGLFLSWGKYRLQLSPRKVYHDSIQKNIVLDNPLFYFLFYSRSHFYFIFRQTDQSRIHYKKNSGPSFRSDQRKRHFSTASCFFFSAASTDGSTVPFFHPRNSRRNRCIPDDLTETVTPYPGKVSRFQDCFKHTGHRNLSRPKTRI